MLRIRLARAGAKKKPFYRIVVADARVPRDGRFVERIGSYNPMLPVGHVDRIVLNTERVRHWLDVGAKPSDRLARFLGDAGLAPRRAIPQQTKKNKPGAKAEARAASRREKQKAAPQAAKADAQSQSTTDKAASPATTDEAAPKAGSTETIATPSESTTSESTASESASTEASTAHSSGTDSTESPPAAG